MPKKKSKKQENEEVEFREISPLTQLGTLRGTAGLPQEIHLPLGLSPEDLEGMMIEDMSPVWNVSFEGFPEMNVLDVKFTMHTTGEPSTGQTVMELECQTGVNKRLNEWIKNPTYKETKIEVVSHDGVLLDVIKMKCRPVAMAVGDLGSGEVQGKPWFTTIQLSSHEIEYLDA